MSKPIRIQRTTWCDSVRLIETPIRVERKRRIGPNKARRCVRPTETDPILHTRNLLFEVINDKRGLTGNREELTKSCSDCWRMETRELFIEAH